MFLFLFLIGDILLIRFARVSSHVTYFSIRKTLTAKCLSRAGLDRSHKLQKALIAKCLQQGCRYHIL